MLNKWQVRRFSGHGWTWDIQQVGPCPTCNWVNSLGSHVLECYVLTFASILSWLASWVWANFNLFLCFDTRTWSRPAETPLLIDWDPSLVAAKLVTLEVPKWVISRFRELLSFGNPWKVSDPELGDPLNRWFELYWTRSELHLCLMAMRVEALRFVLVGGMHSNTEVFYIKRV